MRSGSSARAIVHGGGVGGERKLVGGRSATVAWVAGAGDVGVVGIREVGGVSGGIGGDGGEFIGVAKVGEGSCVGVCMRGTGDRGGGNSGE